MAQVQAEDAGGAEFSALMRALGDLKTGLLGGLPSDRELAGKAEVAPTTIGKWLKGQRFPQDLDKVRLVVREVRGAAIRQGRGRPNVEDLLEEDRFVKAYQREARRRAGLVSAAVQQAQAQAALASDSSGTRDFFRYLIASHTALFAGRNLECSQILEFVRSRGTGYVFVEAPSGYGKTSLLAYLVDQHPEFCYHFISQVYRRGGLGFDPTELTGLLRNLCEQLDPSRVPADDPQRLGRQFRQLLSEPANPGTVIVLDAIDEIVPSGQLWGVLPPSLPTGLVIILSARTQGDRSPLQDMNLSVAQMSLHVQLHGLDEAALIELLELAGGAASALAQDRDFVAKLHQASRGDPFYLRFLVDDVASGVLSGASVGQAPSGLAAYLDLQLEMLAKSAYRPQHAAILGLLLQEPVLSRTDLLANDNVEGLTSLNFDIVMREIHRFLLVHNDQYTFCHDRFREYFRRGVSS